MASRKPFLLRIDPELWADLEGWAKDELRSVNGQIEYLLKQAVRKRKGLRRQTNPQPQRPGSAED
ncbi:MAG: ribbon-helix-helix domain-containing protein [Limisphaerales bacterium]